MVIHNSLRRIGHVVIVFCACIIMSNAQAPIVVAAVNTSFVSSKQFTAIVTKVIDGDSIIAVTSGTRIKIRLWGIDAPEWDQPCSNEAKKYLRKRLLKKVIDVFPLYYDKYGRLIATVKQNNININQILVERGLAWVHVYYCDKEICDEWYTLEKLARTKKRGLWRGSHPTPPWIWKNK